MYIYHIINTWLRSSQIPLWYFTLCIKTSRQVFISVLPSTFPLKFIEYSEILSKRGIIHIFDKKFLPR